MLVLINEVFILLFQQQQVLCVGLALCSMAAAARGPWCCRTNPERRREVELASDAAVQHLHAPLVQRDAPVLGQTGGTTPTLILYTPLYTTLYTPFIDPVYTFIAVHTPMYTQYTCIYNHTYT